MSRSPNDESEERHEERHEEKLDDEIPRQSFLSALPKRTFHRVVFLLAALAAILYLRQRTGSIAGCMSSAFEAPAPGTPPATPTIKASVLLPDGGARR